MLTSTIHPDPGTRYTQTDAKSTRFSRFTLKHTCCTHSECTTAPPTFSPVQMDIRPPSSSPTSLSPASLHSAQWHPRSCRKEQRHSTEVAHLSRRPPTGRSRLPCSAVQMPLVKQVITPGQEDGCCAVWLQRAFKGAALFAVTKVRHSRSSALRSTRPMVLAAPRSYFGHRAAGWPERTMRSLEHLRQGPPITLSGPRDRGSRGETARYEGLRYNHWYCTV